MYRYELHLHTFEGSLCGQASAAEMVDYYIQNGYAGAVITDHFYHGNTAPSRELAWEDYFDAYETGYLNAKKAAEGKDFDVFFGIEEKGTDWDEYIVLGLAPAWYRSHPELREIRGNAFLDMVRDAGGFVIHVHPYRQRSYMRNETIWLNPDHVDAIEVRNCGNPVEVDRLAYEYAATLPYPITGGSDNHATRMTARELSGIELPVRVRTEAELIAAIREKKHTVIGLEAAKNAPLTKPRFAVKYL